MVIGENRAHRLRFSCQIDLNGFGEVDDNGSCRITMCSKLTEVGQPKFNCGFEKFCKDCEKRFICATERK